MAAKTSDPIDILLELGIDLDNLSEEEDYLSALKEAIATIEFTTGGGDERSAALREEVIKVRKSRKAADSKFKARKTTIKPDAFFDKKKPEGQRQPIPGQRMLPGSMKPGALIKPDRLKSPEEDVAQEEKKQEANIFQDILAGVNSILETLNKQNRLSKIQSEKDRRDKETQRRRGAEDELEKSPLKKFMGTAEKLVKPVKGFFESIFDFIKNILIGRLLVKIIDFLGKKENQEKIEAIKDFFVATWPALLAAFVAFKLGLAGFIGGLIASVLGFIPKLLGLIPKMLGGLKTLLLGNPLATAAVAVVAATAIGAITANQPGTAVIKDPEDPDKSQADEIREFGGMTSAPISGEMLGFDQYNLGGLVPGSGPNKDTVPAMLTPGEFVMSRGAVQNYGTDTLESMNAMSGGTNLPKRINDVTYASGGGLINRSSAMGQGIGRSQRRTRSLDENPQEGGKPRSTSIQTDKNKVVDPFPEGSYKGQSGQKFGDSRRYGGHVGIDVTEDSPYKKDPKRPIYAAKAGKVLGERYDTSSYTAGLMIDHGDMQTRYVHMLPRKQPGDEVKAGEQIGVLKPLGRAPRYNQTHLHFELYRGSKLVNPTTFFTSAETGQSYIPTEGDSAEFSTSAGQTSDELGTDRSGAVDTKPTAKFGSGIRMFQEGMGMTGTSDDLAPTTTTLEFLKNMYGAPASQDNQSMNSDTSPNPAATLTSSGNELPAINANAMISQEKIKVLGIIID